MKSVMLGIVLLLSMFNSIDVLAKEKRYDFNVHLSADKVYQMSWVSGDAELRQKLLRRMRGLAKYFYGDVLFAANVNQRYESTFRSEVVVLIEWPNPYIARKGYYFMRQFTDLEVNTTFGRLPLEDGLFGPAEFDKQVVFDSERLYEAIAFRLTNPAELIKFNQQVFPKAQSEYGQRFALILAAVPDLPNDNDFSMLGVVEWGSRERFDTWMTREPVYADNITLRNAGADRLNLFATTPYWVY